MRDEVCLWLQGLVETTGTGRTDLSLETPYGRMLADPFKEETLQFLAERVRESVLMKARHGNDGDICTQLVN